MQRKKTRTLENIVFKGTKRDSNKAFNILIRRKKPHFENIATNFGPRNMPFEDRLHNVQLAYFKTVAQNTPPKKFRDTFFAQIKKEMKNDNIGRRNPEGGAIRLDGKYYQKSNHDRIPDPKSPKARELANRSRRSDPIKKHERRKQRKKYKKEAERRNKERERKRQNEEYQKRRQERLQHAKQTFNITLTNAKSIINFALKNPLELKISDVMRALNAKITLEEALYKDLNLRGIKRAKNDNWMTNTQRKLRKIMGVVKPYEPLKKVKRKQVKISHHEIDYLLEMTYFLEEEAQIHSNHLDLRSSVNMRTITRMPSYKEVKEYFDRVRKTIKNSSELPLVFLNDMKRSVDEYKNKRVIEKREVNQYPF
jgi:hypothetical protein